MAGEKKEDENFLLPDDRRERGDRLPAAAERNQSRVPLAAAMISALAASACCWLPLLLIALGLSSGGVAAGFEKWRPVLLPLTFVLLASAFYLTFRKPVAAGVNAGSVPDDDDSPFATHADTSAEADCCPHASTRSLSVNRLNKVILVIATVFVFVFALFPNYSSFLLGTGDDLDHRGDLDRVVVTVEGMTCGSCATTCEKALRSVDGVADAKVSYDEGQAVIGIPKGSDVPIDQIWEAISRVGFEGHFKVEGEFHSGTSNP